MYSLFNIMPVVTTHSYHYGKLGFLLPQDTYPEWVILAVEEGEFEYNINGEKGVASFGDLVLCPPNTVLQRKALTETISYHFILFSWASVNSDSKEEDPITVPTGKIRIHDQERLTDNFAYIRKAYEMQEWYHTRRVGQLLFDIWYLFCVESAPSNSVMSIIDTGTADPLMETIALKINEHALQQVVLKEIAAEHGLSPMQLTRRFQAAFGLNPIHYINTIRIQKAQTLLLETNMKLQQIAEMCGYENGFYFSRIFKKKLGISPSQFRKRNKF